MRSNEEGILGEGNTPERGSRLPWRWILIAVGFLIAAVVVWDLRSELSALRPRVQHRSSPAAVPASLYRNTDKSVAFVGDEVCARCHTEIASSYRGHPMGRSMQKPAEAQSGSNGVVFKVADLVYSVLQRDGRVFHREEKHDGQGRTVASTEMEVRYLLGSGQRGRAFLVERESGLFQSPISWYAQGRAWNLAPRYDIQNLHFDRQITPGCLFCHSNRFTSNVGRAPVFHGLAIGCERCHGPGELHAQNPATVDGRDLTIVNPADLQPRSLRESVCEQCHLQGIERRDLPGRSIFDYRPGLPFGEFVAVSYARGDPVALRRSVGQVEQMRASRCYEQSQGELGCISCHGPHSVPSRENRVAYYRDRCMRCHAGKACTLAREERLDESPDDDCTACHMPRSQTVDIAHTAITVHYIPRHRPTP
jgi:hypothetical protein